MTWGPDRDTGRSATSGAEQRAVGPCRPGTRHNDRVNDPTDGAPDADLRRDVRLVTSLLGETLRRAEGDDLLALVERVRTLAKDDTLADLPELDLETTTKLARAFTAYFHLANVAEQVHRGRTLLRARRDEGGPTGWVHDALARVVDAGIDAETIAAGIPHV